MAVVSSFLRASAMATICRTRRRCLSLRSMHPSLIAPFPLRPARLSSSSSCCSRIASAVPAITELEVEQTQVLVQGRELAVVQPRDVDNILDMYIKQGRLDGDPYWCQIWPSAIVLAEEMMKNSQLVAGLDVCDLGSGLGLAGVSALVAGAKQVVFYDQEPWALFCSLLTVHLNVPHARTNLPFLLRKVFVDCTPEYLEYLTSGLALSSEIFELGSTQKGTNLMARAEVLDWSKKQTDALCFNTVLACDVLYEKASVSHIAAILPCLLRRSGKVVMTDPTHRTPQNREEFLSLIGTDSDGKVLKLERMDSIKLRSNDKMEDVELMQFCFN